MELILNILKYISSSEAFQTVFKLIFISLLAGMLGHEREHSKKPAGLRTYVLVGVSAVLVMLCGMSMSNEFGNNDPSRMPAQLLSGIGFIGAGTILSNGFKVKGLTTAAGLLAITCIGLSVGAGMYWQSLLATLIVYVILRYSFFFSKVDHSNEFKFKIIAYEPKDILEKLNAIVSDNEMEVKKVTIQDGEGEKPGSIMYYCKVVDSSFDESQFITDVAKLEKVKQVNEI